MKKWFVGLLLILSPCGCAEIPRAEHGQEMALHEMKKGHLFWWVEKQHVSLTDQQIDELARYGIKIGEPEKTVVYYSMARRRGRSEMAKAFPVKGEGEYGHFELVVDVGRTITIQEIHIIKNPTHYCGEPIINKDFIEQFIGKDLTFSFELAKESDDPITAPTKIKPIGMAPITSEKIVKELEKWLVIAKILKRDYPIWSVEQ